mgnify:CR=1 FL=1
MLAANTIEDIVMPELDPNEQIQYSIFSEEINDESAQYPYLADGYYAAIKNNANKQIMIDNNLFPLSSMIEEYQNSMKYESKGEEANQKDFLDQLKCLGIK